MKYNFEENKLIVKFLNNKVIVTGQHIFEYNIPKDISYENLLFHKSWDWLIPVFEKIKYIEDNQEEFFGEDYYIISFEIDLLNGVDIKIDKKRIFMQTAFGEGQLIDALHGGVIEFIKWYNKNDKQL